MKRILLLLVFLVFSVSARGQTPGTQQYPTALDTPCTLYTASNFARTTLTASLSSSATTITVASTTLFPSCGSAMINGEIVTWTGKTSTTFTGVTRGAESTAAVAHIVGERISQTMTADYHNKLVAVIISLQEQLGYGVSTAASATTGYCRKKNSDGTVTWQSCAGGGGGTTYTFSSPLTEVGGTVSMSAASGSQNGYLSSANFTTFNNKQAGDADLTTIAGLSPASDDVLQYKAGAWANRTISQLKNDLSLTGTNSGDQNVFASIPVSGQTTVTPASTSQALTLVAGTNVTITTDNTAKSITFSAAGGGGGAPGGSNTQLQYNNASSLGGISGATSNGTNITVTSGNLIATRPKITTSIDDSNGNEVIKTPATTSAVNEVTITNSATGNPVSIAATGGDTDIDLTLSAKGAGKVNLGDPSATTSYLDLLASAAPSTPSPGTGTVYVDATSKNLAVKDDAGVVKHGVQTKAAVSNSFATAISDDGTVTVAQPSVSNLSGFGTGVATFLGTPSSANLASTLTDETGTGAAMFATSPTNVTLDVEGTGNSITTVEKVWFQAAGCNNATASSFWDLGTSLAPTPTCQNNGSGSTAQNATLDFPDSDGAFFAHTSLMLPTDFTGNVDARIRWKAAATTGDVIWSIATICVADGETDNPSYNTATAFAADTAKGTTLQSNDVSATSITITGCSGGELMHIKVFRDRTTAGDTIAGVVSFLGLQLTYRRAE